MPFPTMFLKAFFSRSFEVMIVWERVKDPDEGGF